MEKYYLKAPQLTQKRIEVIDCEIPIDDKVLPMVAPGASINDMMGFIDNENP